MCLTGVSGFLECCYTNSFVIISVCVSSFVILNKTCDPPNRIFLQLQWDSTMIRGRFEKLQSTLPETK